MNLWIAIGITAACLSVFGVIAAYRSKDMKLPFIFGFNTLLPITLIYCYFGTGDALHKGMIVVMVAIYQFRMNLVLTKWYGATAASKLKSVMPLSAIYIMPIVLVNIFAWVYCLPFYWAANITGGFGIYEAVIIIVYAIGTVWHFGSDYQKYVFKNNSDNRGKIICSGFWKYSRHPNYFGDFLIYLSFGLTSGNYWGLISPVMNVVQYFSDAIPKSEKMAAERYGQDWINYKKKVRCFIPYVF